MNPREQRGQITQAIHDWLLATSEVEIPVGMSRIDAQRQGSDLLSAILAGTADPAQVALDDDLKDVLWSLVVDFEGKPVGLVIEDCDRVYQFLLAIAWENDQFGERDELLHKLARAGWSSTHGGLEAVLSSRASVWDHGNEERHRDV